jgi:hypothetical protein
MPVIARGGRHAGRGSGLGLDAIAHDGGYRMLAAHPAGQAARVPSRGTREPRPCPAGSPIIAARIPAVAGVPGLARRFLPGRIRQGPSMYEMEGPCCVAAPSRPASWLRRRRAPPAGARYPREGPVSRLLPRSGVAPRWCPFPTVRHFYCLRGRRARARCQPFQVFPLSTN